MCTNLSIVTKPKATVENPHPTPEVLVARTMDFASPTGVSTAEWPVGHQINKDWKVNIPFKAKFTEKDFGVLGKLRCVSDGFNRDGLSIGTLWLPSAQFKNTLHPTGDEVSGLIAVQAILGNCSTVADAIAFLRKHPIVMPAKVIDRFVTLHFDLVDKHGDKAVVEFGTDGVPSSVQFYKNVVGVLTNAPEYPWQVRNLSNFTQIGLENTPSKKFGDFEAKHTGFGANQLGLAGDMSPPSRFVRATTVLHAAMDYAHPKNATEAELLLDKVIGSVWVIQGTSCDTGTFGKKWDYTQWAVMKNLTTYSLKIKTADSLGFVEVKPQSVGDGTDENEKIWEAFSLMTEKELAEFDRIFGL